MTSRVDLGAANAHLPVRLAYLVITDRSFWLIRRGPLGRVGRVIAHLPIAAMRSLEPRPPQRAVLRFGDDSVWTLDLANRSALPYLQSLSPWIELGHRREADGEMTAAPGPAAGSGPR